ncbi:MAG: SMI1/KNR4 family protein [Candidatus Parabeggiatoa sp.]|nr:SMI1/KNR4 family protein [Candidatus Parabeggiatoa sp.]
MDKNTCIEFWLRLKEKIPKFEKLDDAEVVFGARTRGSGHNYKILPVVTDQEISAFEKNNGFELPLEYKTYIKTFGAGGAGPYYGISDFRKQVLPSQFLDPFPYSETVEFTDETEDDDPIWDYPGLAFIGEYGCGTEFLIELNGTCPGTIWCNGSYACSKIGTFMEFYQQWVNKVEVGLERYQLLKSLRAQKMYSLETIIETMQCRFNEQTTADRSCVPESEIWIHFEKTPGRVVVNEKKEVLRINIYDRNSIV